MSRRSKARPGKPGAKAAGEQKPAQPKVIMEVSPQLFQTLDSLLDLAQKAGGKQVTPVIYAWMQVQQESAQKFNKIIQRAEIEKETSLAKGAKDVADKLNDEVDGDEDEDEDEAPSKPN